MKRMLWILTSALGVSLLAACQSDEPARAQSSGSTSTRSGTYDSTAREAGARTADTGAAARDSTARAADSASKSVDRGVDATKDASRNASGAMKDATGSGVGTGTGTGTSTGATGSGVGSGTGTGASTGAAGDVTAKADQLVNQTTQYVKENKLELAEKSLTQLEQLKPQLPQTYHPKIDQARSLFDTAKKGANLLGK